MNPLNCSLWFPEVLYSWYTIRDYYRKHALNNITKDKWWHRWIIYFLPITLNIFKPCRIFASSTLWLPCAPRVLHYSIDPHWWVLCSFYRVLLFFWRFCWHHKNGELLHIFAAYFWALLLAQYHLKQWYKSFVLLHFMEILKSRGPMIPKIWVIFALIHIFLSFYNIFYIYILQNIIKIQIISIKILL